MAAAGNLKQGILDYICQTVEVQMEGEAWTATRPYNWQVVRALAYLYTLGGSPFKGSTKVADAMREVYGAIQASPDVPDNRLTGHLAETHLLLDEAGALNLLPKLDEQVARGAAHLFERLEDLRRLTHFTSANNGTSTNHVAVYGASVYRAGEVLKREEYTALARDTWVRLCDDQHPDGFWAETTPGPTPSYNNLTFCCAGRMARYTGEKRFREAALRGARFHRVFCYPDTCDLETIDGRVRYKHHPHWWGGFVFSETPDGRGFMATKLATLRKAWPPKSMGTHGGELLALMSEDHQYWVDGPEAPWEQSGPNHVAELQGLPGGVRKQGPWFVCLQGIAHLLRGWGGFTIDRTSVFSLWHEKTGLIVNGSGEPGIHSAQSFKINLPWDKEAPPVPETARVAMGVPGSKEPARLHAEFRGATVRVDVSFVSGTEVALDVKAGMNRKYYPAEFTLQLELREGDRVNGEALGAHAVEFNAERLKGRIDAGRFVIEFPAAGARLVWPHDPYNPYDTVNKRSASGAYVSLLKLPLGPDGVRVVFKIS